MATAHNLTFEGPAPGTIAPLQLLFAANFRESRLSGIGNHLSSLAGALARRGHSVEIVWAESLESGRKSQRISRLLFPYQLAQFVARRARNGKRYDVLNIHEPSAMWCTLRRRLQNALPPVVVTSHGIEQRAWEIESHLGSPSLRSRIVYPLTQLQQSNFSLRHADRAAVLSQDDAAFAELRLRIPSDRIRVLSNGCDDSLFAIHRKPSATPRLLFIGSWIPRKGTALLARAFSRLREDRPALELYLAGTVLDASHVLQHFPRKDRSRITVLPTIERSELTHLLAHDQVFVLPSLFEGMPLSLLEALAAGLPCVTSDLCGMRDLIAHGRNGYRLPADDELAWTRLLRELLQSHERRQALGAAARSTAREKTWDRVAADWEALFAEVAQPHASAASRAQKYDSWHQRVLPRDDISRDLANPWHTFARKNAGDVQGLRVLDAACGRGTLSRWLAEQGAQVVAADFSQAAGHIARNNLLRYPQAAISCADVQALPFANCSFDVVFSCETIEHVPSPVASLREFARVLRPGGRLILTTENYLNIWGLYRIYCGLRRRTFNSGDTPQPLEKWMFSPLTRRAIRRAGFRIQVLDGEQHHLYLLPRTNPADCEARWLSQSPFTRKLLRSFGRRFYVVARKEVRR